jgi:signal transduction histidine kinase
VHKIITAHGGTISVSSRLNEGTQFIIKLPLHP